MENQMFCYQCQETAGCSGCTRVGVCGKRKYKKEEMIYRVGEVVSCVGVVLSGSVKNSSGQGEIFLCGNL